MRYTGICDATQDRNASKYEVLAEKILLECIGSTKSWLNKPFSTHQIKEIGDAFGTDELGNCFAGNSLDVITAALLASDRAGNVLSLSRNEEGQNAALVIGSFAG